MQILFDVQEEKAIQAYAGKHGLTFDEAMKKIIDAMTMGLLELAKEDGEFEDFLKKDDMEI